MKYDYLVVGAGLFGATFANLAKSAGKKVLIIDKRPNVAGNIYTENIEGINVHKYGAHIFHTDYKDVWDYVNSFVEFNRYTNSPVARIGDEIYNMPFNMNTFSKIWNDVFTPEDALRHIEEEKKEIVGEPKNLEEQAISLVGRTIYEKLVKCYTEKQWNRKCTELPSFIIKRLPVRFTYDNNYFHGLYQGIPVGGYTPFIENLLKGCDVKVNTDFFTDKDKWLNSASKVLFTGMIDEYYDYCYGELEYRSLEFKNETLDTDNYQGTAVMNFTDRDTPFTRIIEHKHLEFANSDKTIITREYPKTWHKGEEAYYPVNDDKNNDLYEKYKQLAKKEDKVIFGGRLGMYKYFDMGQVIEEALNLVKSELN